MLKAIFPKIISRLLVLFQLNIGLECFKKDEEISGKLIRIKIWDTAGQEQYKSITKNFFRNANGVLVVYDVTNKTSFNKVKDWIQSIKENSNVDIKVILIANKIDIERTITSQEGQKLAEHFNYPYFETSAKNNVGINEAITSIVKSIIGKKKNYMKDSDSIGKFSLNSSKSFQTINNSNSYCKC